MACLVVMYKTPKDPGAFDKYYFETHVPIAKKSPACGNMKSAAGRLEPLRVRRGII
jgi:uncharacterized protein (TIGR02118 family)